MIYNYTKEDMDIIRKGCPEGHNPETYLLEEISRNDYSITRLQGVDNLLRDENIRHEKIKRLLGQERSNLQNECNHYVKEIYTLKLCPLGFPETMEYTKCKICGKDNF